MPADLRLADYLGIAFVLLCLGLAVLLLDVAFGERLVGRLRARLERRRERKRERALEATPIFLPVAGERVAWEGEEFGAGTIVERSPEGRWKVVRVGLEDLQGTFVHLMTRSSAAIYGGARFANLVLDPEGIVIQVLSRLPEPGDELFGYRVLGVNPNADHPGRSYVTVQMSGDRDDPQQLETQGEYELDDLTGELVLDPAGDGT